MATEANLDQYHFNVDYDLGRCWTYVTLASVVDGHEIKVGTHLAGEIQSVECVPKTVKDEMIDYIESLEVS